MARPTYHPCLASQYPHRQGQTLRAPPIIPVLHHSILVIKVVTSPAATGICLLVISCACLHVIVKCCMSLHVICACSSLALCLIVCVCVRVFVRFIMCVHTYKPFLRKGNIGDLAP